MIAASRTQQGYLSYTIISGACIDLTDVKRLCILPSQYYMTQLRAFIAIKLPSDVQANLEKIKEELALPGSGSVRWVSKGNIHLTLKFLGEIPDTDIEKINAVFDPHLRTFKSFSVNLSELGAFPNFNRPRVLWVGVQPLADLLNLQTTIDDRLLQLNYAQENCSFHPHLTLGRVSDHADSREVGKVINKMKDGAIEIAGVIPVDRIILFRSDLKPSGPVYTMIHSWLLS